VIITNWTNSLCDRARIIIMAYRSISHLYFGRSPFRSSPFALSSLKRGLFLARPSSLFFSLSLSTHPTALFQEGTQNQSTTASPPTRFTGGACCT